MTKIKVRLNMPTSNQYADVLTTEKIEKKISRLKSLNLREIDDATLRLAIKDVISYKPDPSANHSVVSMVSSHRTIIKGTNLYRVRTCGTNPLEDMKIENDAWNPPVEFVKQGRVNQKKESLLYVAEGMETAIKEIKIKTNQYFWLIVYELKKDIRVVNIGNSTNEESKFTPIHNKIADFLRNEFTREVKYGEEYKYRVSNMIAKEFYPYKIYNFEGWSYPSVANKGLYSLCLDPKIARKKMKVKYSSNYLMQPDDLKLDYIGHLNKTHQFIYEKIEE
jgi:hypothetical protein